VIGAIYGQLQKSRCASPFCFRNVRDVDTVRNVPFERRRKNKNVDYFNVGMANEITLFIDP
jgi:hypothetical protein